MRRLAPLAAAMFAVTSAHAQYCSGAACGPSVGGVPSVFGRSGAITAQSGDYSAAQVGADPSGAAAALLSQPNSWSGAQSFSSIIDSGISGVTQCVHVNSSGTLSGTGSDCSVSAYAGQAIGPVMVTSNKSSDGSTTTMHMAGLGATFSFTPSKSTRELVTLYCTASNASNASIDTFQPYYGTGNAPANLAATTGTAVGGQIQARTATSNAPAPFSVTLALTGLIVGTTYWFDVAMAPSTGSYTLTINPCTFSAVDV